MQLSCSLSCHSQDSVYLNIDPKLRMFKKQQQQQETVKELYSECAIGNRTGI